MSNKENPAKTPVSAPSKAAPPPPRRRKLVGQPMPAAGGGLPGATAEKGAIGIWGSANSGVSGYGTVVSAGLRKSATREGYPNDEGEFTGYCYYNFLSTGTFECLLPSTGLGTALDAGDSISIGGESLLVDDAEELWNNNGWAKYRVNASKHAAIGAT